MGAIFGSILANAIEVAVFVVIAWAGITLGKSKAMKKAADSREAR